MTKIKICGLTRNEDIEAVNRYLPDIAGFVFAESRRKVTPEQAGLLKSKLDTRIRTAGVFTDAPTELIAGLCRSGIIDIVQLHGDETEQYIRELKQKITCPVIKAVRVQSSEQILQAQQLSCDMLLLDTWQKGKYGGSGKTFDHSMIPVLEKPFFLAGGLDCSNVSQAILKCRPYGIDVSSGVETDGVKDEEKIREIIKLVRLSDERMDQI